MPQISRPQLAVYVAAAVAVALIGARYLQSTRTPSSAGRAPTAPPLRLEAAGGGYAMVQVVGAVRRPGVYRLPGGGRVDDAVRRAGGATRRANLAGVNLAAKLSDGQQIVVPAAGVPGAAASAALATGGSGTPGSGDGGAAGAAGGASGAPLDLNTATVEQLDQLDGVGPSTAQRIVAYRQQHNGFRSVSELDAVPGIGAKKLAALKDRVRV